MGIDDVVKENVNTEAARLKQAAITIQKESSSKHIRDYLDAFIDGINSLQIAELSRQSRETKV